jgi:hydrogenase nickel incorporation protein HypA/HybF
MHELSLAREILEIVRQNLPLENGGNIKSVRLRIGEMAGVVPESLEFCFEALAQGTSIEGAAFIMEKIPLIVRCATCGKESRIEQTFFVCPLCNSRDLSIVSGRELEVSEIEIEDR